MDESGPVQNRQFRRSNVLLKATLEMPDASLPVVLRNLSQKGALVQGEILPEEGARVLFHRDGLSVPSRVIWSHCNHTGLHFDFPLFPRELLRHIPTRERKPPPPPINRRPGFGAQPLTEGERILIERWAAGGARQLGD
ncbi:MAG: PilZ domain-containing protein [Sphingomicrobium sp.]